MSPESIHSFLRYQRRTDIFREFLLENAIASFFHKQGYTVNEESLQESADNFRESHGLYTMDDFEQWISKIEGYTIDDFEQMLTHRLYRDFLLNHHFETGSLHEYFEKNSWKYAQWDLSLIKVEDIGIANEIYALIKDEGYSFVDLAARFSLDLSSSRIGGRIGPRFGRDLESLLAVALLENNVIKNKLILHQDLSGFHNVYKIEGHVPPIFDEMVASLVQTDFLEDFFFSE